MLGGIDVAELVLDGIVLVLEVDDELVLVIGISKLELDVLGDEIVEGTSTLVLKLGLVAVVDVGEVETALTVVMEELELVFGVSLVILDDELEVPAALLVLGVADDVVLDGKA